MRICDDLRHAVLQAAIQGKLTKQLPEDGNAKDLLNVTLHSVIDGRKVKEKEIADISEDEIEFDIPSNWQWAKLGLVCIVARGGSPRPIKEYITNSPDGINWIKIGDTDKGGKYITSVKEKIKPSGVSKSRFVHEGDFLLTNSMSFGRPYILKVDGCIHDGWLVISQPKKVFDDDYLYWLLSSNYAYRQFCGKVSGAVVKNLNSDKVANSIFPLPPLAEQHRIVAKVEELMARIDDLEKTEIELEKLKAAFPGDMKAALLQAAMQGKLTEQLPEDGDADEQINKIFAEKEAYLWEKGKKKVTLKPITEKDLYFDIPKNWSVIRLGRVVSILGRIGFRGFTKSDFTDKTGAISLSPGNLLPSNRMTFETCSYIKWEKYNESPEIKIQSGDLLLVKTGSSYGKCAIVEKLPKEATINPQLARIVSHGINISYLHIVFSSPFAKSQFESFVTGTATPTFSQEKIANFVLPFPPLAEQKRIVEKLDKLLPLCDGLVEE